jgi:uncharacterized membrane protein YphA (DoxX/SURF4 family)
MSLDQESKRKSFAVLRILFGLVWAADAYFKWQPGFMSGFVSYLTGMLSGQPPFVAKWITFWVNIVNTNPHLFATIVACAETAIAFALLFGFLTRVAIAGGAVLTFLIWSTAQGFGGPYMAGSTDIGTCIIYVFVFAALWIGESWSAYSVDAILHGKFPGFFLWKNQNNDAREVGLKGKDASPDRKLLIIKILLLVVAVLASFLVVTYLPRPVPQPSVQTSGSMAGMGAMPPGMTLKAFDLEPSSTIPTVDCDIEKDSASGWNIHIITANFAFTPENVNKPPIANQGHAHLYVDGTLHVVYGSWYHIDDLAKGPHLIAVTLNANDHSVFAVNGVYVKKVKTITQE